jgi:RecA-family ATPase
MLGGKKKTGKSFLCLQLAQAVAGGVPCLGRAVLAGPVIYICLEDGRRRLKDRLEKQAAGRGLPITYFTRFPALDGEGMAELITLLDSRRPRLLIIDTLAAAKTGKTVENEAGPMADLTNSLRILAQHFSLGILVTHHHGKAIGGDPGDDLRGSSAIAGAADVNLGLYRDEGGFNLKGEGRDIEQFSLRLCFDRQTTWCWQLIGDSRKVDDAEVDKETLEALRALGEADAATVAEALGKHRTTVSRRLILMANSGLVIPREESAGRGRPRVLYRVACVEHAQN